jgi:hypothetical protein
MAGRDQVPLGIDLLKTPEQEAAQAPGLFDLTLTGSTFVLRWA